ncbi:MAG: hypothetical protein IJV27_08800 [Prevotella sp.]|nr:hypothetical protein [Prevotella sp.]
MKQLSKLQNIIFLAGGLLMTVGAGAYAFLFMQKFFSLILLAGAVAFASMQILQRYDGHDLVLRRLRKIMVLADLLFVLAGLLVVEEQYGLVGRLLAGRGDLYIAFVNATFGKWVVVLLVAAILEIYTVHRISHELEKESGNH